MSDIDPVTSVAEQEPFVIEPEDLAAGACFEVTAHLCHKNSFRPEPANRLVQAAEALFKSAELCGDL